MIVSKPLWSCTLRLGSLALLMKPLILLETRKGLLGLIELPNEFLMRAFFRGTCPCSVGRKCENPTLWCNCDSEDDKWNSDDGFYTTGNSLGITEMVFLQQPDLPEDALGRITLGPLECVETSAFYYCELF